MIKLKIKEFNNKEFEIQEGLNSIEIAKLVGYNNSFLFVESNGNLVSSKEKITTSGNLSFDINVSSNEWWIKFNETSAKSLMDFLLKNNFATKQLQCSVDENGFNVIFETSKNISENQLSLIQNKFRKYLLIWQSENLKVDPKLLKFVSLQTINNKQIYKDINCNSISGFATITQDLYDLKLKEISNRLERDHRKIGKELELFLLSDEAGKGLPIWLENGVILKSTIKRFIDKLLEKYNYEIVETPIIAPTNLFKTSGHYSHYKHGMFPEMVNQEKESFMLRPMACPSHILIYKSKPRSYKELPIRYAENVKQYRYESSGSLLGLERVRAMELTDGHIFITPNSLKEEIMLSYNLIIEALKKFEIQIDYVELALHNSSNMEKYHGNKKMWEETEKILTNFLIENNIKYKALIGEAAFYGPKIDIQIRTSLNHLITLATIQLDFLLPEKFQLEYVDSNLNKQRPIMIHRGLIGTYERFIAILLEQTKGVLPFWLSPKQVAIIPITDKQNDFSEKINSELKKKNIRSFVDKRNERLSSKIREAQIKKIPIQIIIGEDEIKNNNISYRKYGETNTTQVSLKEFISFVVSINND